MLPKSESNESEKSTHAFVQEYINTKIISLAFLESASNLLLNCQKASVCRFNRIAQHDNYLHHLLKDD